MRGCEAESRGLIHWAAAGPGAEQGTQAELMRCAALMGGNATLGGGLRGSLYHR
jgi:hypothetical protein